MVKIHPQCCKIPDNMDSQLTEFTPAISFKNQMDDNFVAYVFDDLEQNLVAFQHQGRLCYRSNEDITFQYEGNNVSDDYQRHCLLVQRINSKEDRSSTSIYDARDNSTEKSSRSSFRINNTFTEPVAKDESVMEPSKTVSSITRDKSSREPLLVSAPSSCGRHNVHYKIVKDIAFPCGRQNHQGQSFPVPMTDTMLKNQEHDLCMEKTKSNTEQSRTTNSCTQAKVYYKTINGVSFPVQGSSVLHKITRHNVAIPKKKSNAKESKSSHSNEPDVSHLKKDMKKNQRHKATTDKCEILSNPRTCDIPKNKHKCTICSKTFGHRSSLKTHLRQQHDHTEEKPHYTCTICQVKFKWKQGLKLHMRHHGKNLPYVCSVCFKGFTTQAFLKRHMSTHRKYKCVVCAREYKCKSGLVHHMESHARENRYKCSVCHESFKWKHRLYLHKKTHTSIVTSKKTYTCSICLEGFTACERLDRHMSQAHATEKPYKCPTCPKSYSYSKNLKKHLVSHTGEGKLEKARTHRCPVCSKSFMYNCVLKEHIQNHSEDKSYQCSFCSKTFTNSRYLRRHEVVVHSESKPFMCNVCAKSFASSAQLTKHLKTHGRERSYKCSFCPKDYLSKRNLETHLRTHTGERPYLCTVCGKSFAYNNSFRYHKRTHLKDRVK